MIKQNAIVCCLGWGDTGKATIVDYLDADIYGRYNGGDNAGHTVVFDGKRFRFHILPVGVLKDKTVFLGPDVAFNPVTFFEDWKRTEDTLERKIKSEVWIDHRAHVILPYHKALDGAREAKLKSEEIGTTKKGIGPTYMDKANRSTDFTIDDLVADDFKERLRENISKKQDELFTYKVVDFKLGKDFRYMSLYVWDRLTGKIKTWNDKLIHDEKFFKKEREQALDDYTEKIYKQYKPLTDKIKPWVKDVSLELNKAIKNKKTVVIEGAQGALLDVIFGTKPYVTSSNTTVGGVQANLGVSLRKFHRIIGVVKAYQTRVGEGPCPTEIGDPRITKQGKIGEEMSIDDKIAKDNGDQNALAKFLRIKFKEYGTTTGRPRRVGYLDLVATKFGVSINDVTEIAITNLDKLAGTEMKLCIGYEKGGQRFNHMVSDLEGVKPIYSDKVYDFSKIDFNDELRDKILEKGWKALPEVMKQYVLDIARFTSRPVGIISIGPGREHKIEEGVYKATSDELSGWRTAYNKAWEKLVTYRINRENKNLRIRFKA